MSLLRHELYRYTEHSRVCKAFEIKLAPSPAVVEIAFLAGFDDLYVDLEHSNWSVDDARKVCLPSFPGHRRIKPIVRVAHQCGDDFVQRVLEAGARGIVFPQVSTKEEAMAAVSICKFAPLGTLTRSPALVQFMPPTQPIFMGIEDPRETGATVFVMIETTETLRNLDSIASVPGVDVLLVGAEKLSIALGTPAQFDSIVFKAALQEVSRCCKEHEKTMGLAGIYDDRAYQSWAIRELQVRWMLGVQDIGCIAKGAGFHFESLLVAEVNC